MVLPFNAYAIAAPIAVRVAVRICFALAEPTVSSRYATAATRWTVAARSEADNPMLLAISQKPATTAFTSPFIASPSSVCFNFLTST